MHLVICYDVAKTSVRNRICRCLVEARGRRVQKSVFELDIEVHELAALKKELKKIKKRGDAVAYYSLCAACNDKKEYVMPQVKKLRTKPTSVEIA